MWEEGGGVRYRLDIERYELRSVERNLEVHICMYLCERKEVKQKIRFRVHLISQLWKEVIA